MIEKKEIVEPMCFTSMDMGGGKGKGKSEKQLKQTEKALYLCHLNLVI